jgi:hypothetical protein
LRVVEREGQRDHRAHRMADHDRLLDAELRKGGVQQLRLRGWRPQAVPGPAAVAKTGTVERDHPVIPRQAFHQAACLEIALRHHVAVNEDHRRPFAAFDDVQAHAVDIEQLPRRRLRALCASRAPLNPRRSKSRTEQGGAGPETSARGRG